MRGILGAKLKIWAELPDEENKFWLKVVQNAGKYAGKSPVEHWLAKIAKRQAISSYRSQIRRAKWVRYRAEITVKIRDSGEEDDWDWESLADKNAVAAYRTLPAGRSFGAGSASSGVVFSRFGGCGNAAAAIIRNKVDGITFEALAKRTGKSVELLRTRISCAYRKMRKRVPFEMRRALVHVYRGGDLEYAKKQSKKPK